MEHLALKFVTATAGITWLFDEISGVGVAFIIADIEQLFLTFCSKLDVLNSGIWQRAVAELTAVGCFLLL